MNGLFHRMKLSSPFLWNRANMSNDSVSHSSPALGTQYGRVLWIVAVGAAAMLLLVVLASLSYTAVSGTEFNPSTLETRTFFYYRIPFTQIGITPVTRKVTKPDWARFLSAKGYWKTAKGGRWDLVSTNLGGESDANILIALMEANDEGGNPFWTTWSKQHPQTAKLLWNRVHRAAQLNLYPYTAVFLQMARRYPDRDTFDKFCKEELHDLLLHDLSQAERNGDSDRIGRLAEFGLAIWPDSEPWKSHASPNRDAP